MNRIQPSQELQILTRESTEHYKALETLAVLIRADEEFADFDNCFFDDPSVDWNASLLTETGTNTVTFNSTAHRKIRLYRAVNNGYGGNGHGTHTQGTLLGSPLNQSDTYNLDYRQAHLLVILRTQAFVLMRVNLRWYFQQARAPDRRFSRP